MISDEEMSDAWGRYHLVGDVIRGEAPDTLSLDLSDKIMAALDNEATVLSPQVEGAAGKFKATVIQLFKPVGQLAIAASAAGLMILGVQQVNVANEDTLIQSPVIQTIPLGGTAEPVSLNFEAQEQISQKQQFIERQRKLQSLLTDHEQQVKFNSVKDKTDKSADEEQNKDK
jgi:sigma-E factor negative regulatory protein RseA